MTASNHLKERLTSSTRQRWHDEQDDVDQVERPKRLLPGKLTADDLAGEEAQRWTVEPGKRTSHEMAPAAMGPRDALRYAEWVATARIDRRAEVDEVEDGSLATAFAFLQEVRGGETLPADLRRRLEQELRADLSNVRVHTDSAAERAASALDARAFTIGDDIYFARGAYDPVSETGIELIAHEVAHVSQQRGGTPSTARRVSRPSDSTERSADDFANRFKRDFSKTPTAGADLATLVEHVRREGRRMEIPYLSEMEEQLGVSLGDVEAYTGDAAKLACQLMSAGAIAIRSVVAFADESPRRDTLLHELTHVAQMGGVKAPIQFSVGSLKVSSPSDSAEVEARSGAGVASVHADPNTIHRDDPATSGSSGGGTSTPEDRLKEFVNWIYMKFPNSPDEPKFGYLGEVSVKSEEDGKEETAEIWDVIYTVSSADKIKRQTYLNSAKEWKQYQTEAKETDLATVLGNTDKRRGLGFTKLHDEESKTWAWIKTTASQPYRDYVLFINDERRKKPEPNKQWVEYTSWVTSLGWGDLKIEGGKRDLKPDAEAEKGKTGHDYRPGEAKLFRKALFKRIAEEYKGKWREFYDKFVMTEPFKKNTGLVGNAFECVVAKALEGGLTKYDSTRFKFTIPGAKADAEATDGDKYTRTSDGSVIEFKAKDSTHYAIVADCKAYQVEMGPDGKTPLAKKTLTGDLLQQAKDYAKAVGADGGEGLKGIRVQEKQGVPKEYTFNHVVYIFPIPEVSKQWYDDLNDVFKDKKYYSLVPPPDGMSFIYEVNPSFTVDLPGPPRAHYHVQPQALFHPGVNVTEVDVNMKRAGSPEVVSGHVTMDMNLGGGMEGKKIKKPLKPAPGGGNPRLDNKFDGLKSKSLEKILKRVDVDAKLIDGGVEAKIDVKPGPSGIPGFNLEKATVTAQYTDAGLKVEGEIGLSHTSGKIDGKVKASWNGADWNFEGTATVKAKLIDGLQPFDIKIKYENGEWSVGCDNVKFEKQLKAVTLTGEAYGVWYNTKTGKFSGQASIKADLGMFGTAGADAEIKENQLHKLTLEYDSPELKYPAKKDPPTFVGSIGGTITYEDGKFSGKIRGSANLNIPALKKIAGDKGLGLAVDAHVKADGSYGGTIATTSPLIFGDKQKAHLEIPHISCTLEDDGSVKGDISIKIAKFKHFEKAQVDLAVDKTGLTIKKVDIKATIGEEGKDKFWGSAEGTYDHENGVVITGTAHYKIKEGLIAKGSITYKSATGKVDVELGMDEIQLFKKKITKSIFKIKKQIPLVSFYQIIGIYLDLGFELSFDFDFDLKMKPTLKLENLDPSNFTFDSISAEIELLGQLSAKLIGTPNLGIGLFMLSPSVLRGGGGLKMPITGEAKLKPSGKFGVKYDKEGNVSGDATVGLSMTFGIFVELKPYAEFVLLDGVYSYPWEGEALMRKEILPEKELFNKTIDFGKQQKEEEPALPEENAAPAPTENNAARKVDQSKGEDKQAEAKKSSTTSEPAETGDQGPMDLGPLKPLIEGLPGYQSAKKIMDKAAAAYKKISEFLGRIFNAIKNFFGSIVDKIEEILDGFAKEGTAYLKTLVKMVLGDTIYEIVEPLIDAIAHNAEEIIGIFETDPPTSAADFVPWSLKLAGKVLKVAWNGFTEVVSALWEVGRNLKKMATKLVTQMVQDGMVGVQRHCYYVWKPIGKNWYFLAASQYKINILGFTSSHKEEGALTNPKSAIGVALFEVLEWLDVPPTYVGWEPDAEEPYNDRWVGDGAGVSYGEAIKALAAKAKAAQQHKLNDQDEKPQRKGKPGSGMEPIQDRPLKE